MRKIFSLLSALLLASFSHEQVINFIFTSDLHYGISRPQFRGDSNVASFKVNAAAVNAMNVLPAAGVDHIEAILVTGDIANREEIGIQGASISWSQFLHDYRDGITLTNISGKKPSLLVTPGNHDASNAAGHTKIMFRDAGSMTGMLALETSAHLDTATYDYHQQKLNYSRNFQGIHFVFVNIWADSVNRIWLEKDLASIERDVPVLLFMHDQPQGDAKHFTNPDHAVSETGADRFEHLLPEIYKDTIPKSTTMEQLGLISFLQRHPNVRAWFHGHENLCEFYQYTGLNNEIALPIFRSDSPMKGELSRPDETKLSFQVISIDPIKKTLRSRECRWNTEKKTGKLVWGAEKMIAL